MYVWELLMQKRKLMFNKTSVVENFFNPPSRSATADKNSPQLAPGLIPIYSPFPENSDFGFFREKGFQFFHAVINFFPGIEFAERKTDCRAFGVCAECFQDM